MPANAAKLRPVRCEIFRGVLGGNKRKTAKLAGNGSGENLNFERSLWSGEDNTHAAEEYRRRGRKSRASAAAPVGPHPRVARLMALAIGFDQMIRDGVVADQAELARLGRVTRERLTHIMNLLNLAPNIQEAILSLELTSQGRDRISERDLRPIAAVAVWSKQHRVWGANQSKLHARH